MKSGWRTANGRPYGVQGKSGGAEIKSGWRAINDRPYRVLRTIRVDRAMCQQNRPLGTELSPVLRCASHALPPLEHKALIT